ncbi:MAG: NnrS family protein [Verrucomicrobiales bacterium]|nr:NnrS family protein [Verrucomicrobiales bacterium]
MARPPPTYKTLPTDSPLWASEPFRVFFPLGIFAAVFGVALWPLFYAGLWPFAPHFQHPRMLMLGFGLAMVVGFLGTAWPRFLEATAFRRWEVIILAVVWIAGEIAYASHQLRLGDACSALLSGLLLILLARRVKFGEDLPPPGFALAFVSVALAFGVTVTWALFPDSLSPRSHQILKLLAWQGMLLLPVLGVGSYLFPRFFVVPGQRPLMSSPRRRMVGVWLSAFLIVGSLILEGFGWVRSASGIRLLALGVWAVWATPAIWRSPAPSTRARALRAAIGMIALALLIRTIWPGPGYAVEHLLLIGGFGMTLLLVADRVTIGHCADPSAAPAKSRLWRWLIGLILMAAATRMAADFKLSLLQSHHIYAALLWISAVIIWLIFHARHWGRSSD